jgi:DNA-binding MarR family transcriptional regulator
MPPPNTPRGDSAAFLLAQIGTFAAKQFAERLARLSLTPAQAGVLRILQRHSPLSQRELAEQLGMHASRLVALMDEMETLGLATREVSSSDRRIHTLRITPKGTETLREIGRVAQEHNQMLASSLSEGERETLRSLLERIAQEKGLTPGVHPGYKTLGDTDAAPRKGK